MQTYEVRENEVKRTERKSKRFWVFLIVGFFAMDFAIAAIAITMAAGDPSFRSIPGYGERAVAWDERQALNDAWLNKKWNIEIRRSDAQSDSLELVITTSANEPVTGCSGEVKLFHYTRVAKQQTATISEQTPGHYIAKVDVAKPGLWSVELNLVTADQEHCWYEQVLDLSRMPTALPSEKPME